MRVLLISTYDLGRQPFGVASPAAWLRRAGVEVDCVDTSREPLADDRIRRASLVAFYLPMHTATRLAGPLLDRVRQMNPAATVAAYGLYAPLNAAWLRDRGVDQVLGPEPEAELVALAALVNSQPTSSSQRVGSEAKRRVPGAESRLPTVSPLASGQVAVGDSAGIPRLAFIQPDRATLPPLHRYAALQMPDGTRRVAGSTEATRGCRHLCRHCPIVPVYRGTFRVVPIDIVIADVRAQMAAGAQHISFGDPDFFNGPRHAARLVERLARECPGLTYDVTIKVEHLLKHASLLPLLRDTGCLFVTSAVESMDDAVLARLRKGHTRADVGRAVALCRASGVTLSPTFVPFTPWTTLGGYVDLVEQVEALDLIEAVAPIQLAIRLLVTSQSALLDLADLRAALQPFDAASLAWPWRHEDERVDALQQEVTALVGSMRDAPRRTVFRAIAQLARARADAPSAATPAVELGLPDRAWNPGSSERAPSPAAAGPSASCASACCLPPAAVPHMTEAWYCCAEPLEYATGCEGQRP